MKAADFDYELPAERIAHEPARPRDAARLFVHTAARDASRHLLVRDLPDVLEPNDLLVMNDTRVRPARLLGQRRTGGAVELLLLEPLPAGEWTGLARPAAKLRPGERVELEHGALVATLVERVVEEDGRPGPRWRFQLAARDASVEDALERVGRMPLPPYIERAAEDDARAARDRVDYQTVYARAPGAVAAPTAGLHFTHELLADLDARGIERAFVTLHVGLGTFQPVTAERVEEHVMHAETYELPEATADAVRRCRARGGRVVSVGSTSARVLESCASASGEVTVGAGETRLFITPGYRFRAVDALLTNFHLPKSTLLMLVGALVGRERILRLYAEALERGYRFYSYGDAMLLLP